MTKDTINTFNIFADSYHSARPGYPAEVFADIKEYCDINDSSRLLEIGAGSGIATVELAKFGCHVTAIEPGEQLAEIAEELTKEHKSVEIVLSSFEDFKTKYRGTVLF